ncbi:hypothetical protein BGW36DRAFT_403445 [Talaromyces proteolyticus]|uniref:LysM domain-containing protein n=1 Tax=Talaromyces proteolyticus TaxID=1131652 RepID=A0AAD4Q6R7_9EURO|nr:uncharacterized protein BGW36DRAFT_403445 [Talaromyces proteolyticus]KAH8705986.1 hypothetical protein BGW36DRAFT_403445 [Talaromyces proteolyticus]
MMAPTSLKTSLFLLLLPQLHLTWATILTSRQQVTCSYESAVSSGDTSQPFSAEWGLTVQTFESLNPGAACPNLVAGQKILCGRHSFIWCTYHELLTSRHLHLHALTYLVVIGSIPAAIDSEFLVWNPSINSADCTNILAGYYYCVDVPGATKADTTTTVPLTSTTPADGITTPTPYQAGMTGNCN